MSGTSDIPTSIRPAARIAGLSPYSPGVDAYSIDLRLDRNERAIVPEPVREILASLSPDLVRAYPDKAPLERLIAERFDVDPEQVLVTNGGDDAIDRCCRAVLEPGTEILIHTPTFEMIERSAHIAGGDVRAVEWFDGEFPLKAFMRSLTSATRAVALVTPNNPTGSEIGVEPFLEVACAAIDRLLIVDLAYTEFADDDLTSSALGLRNAVVVRTFSKAFGLAGMRVGYAVGHPDVIRWLRAVGGPYPTSGISLALAAALWRLGDQILQPYLDHVKRERSELHAILRSHGIGAIPSSANFVLAVFGNPAGALRVRDGLAQRGIAVRGFREPPLLQGALRINCPGDPSLFERLRSSLLEVLP